MAVIRIRCRPNLKLGVARIMSTISDVEVFVVRDDGDEEPLHDVQDVHFHAECAMGCPENRVKIVLAGAEVDLEAEGTIEPAPARKDEAT